MPIKPENAARYPKDWKQIRDRIVHRARNRCEFCGIANGALGARNGAGKWLSAEPMGEKGLRLEWPKPGDIAWCSNDHFGRMRTKIVRIVLTVAHLDHTPENCADDNLKALCQRCHLTYDAKHHAQNAAETRRKGKAAGDMFASTAPREG